MNCLRITAYLLSLSSSQLRANFPYASSVTPRICTYFWSLHGSTTYTHVAQKNPARHVVEIWYFKYLPQHATTSSLHVCNTMHASIHSSIITNLRLHLAYCCCYWGIVLLRGLFQAEGRASGHWSGSPAITHTVKTTSFMYACIHTFMYCMHASVHSSITYLRLHLA
jgi:hypothetical protein